MHALAPLDKLQQIRAAMGERTTRGLDASRISTFLGTHPDLGRAIDEAYAQHLALRDEWGDRAPTGERDLVAWLQEPYVNFYGPDAVNPYVPLAARGPWIVTSHGAVLHDSGGYGMLGLGHGPDEILDVLPKPWVIANIMTASYSHRRFAEALHRELGHTRGGSPFEHILCMNSGSEAVSVATRISDIHAERQTRVGARHHGKTIKLLALQGGFHGRTGRPSQASHSTRPAYRKHLATFRHRDNLVVVPANDIGALRDAFAEADATGVFFEMMLMEPVMGEGRPGLAIHRAFYDEARRLTDAHGTLLLVDSIQAGLRAHGVLSIVDYPGFADAAPPDLETWSKALNAAQFPLSVLGIAGRAVGVYQRGVYGNTMTANPRALEVGTATLSALTPELRSNIVDRGAELLDGLASLAAELPEVIVGVEGTGLLAAADIDPAHPVVGAGAVEEQCRRAGLGVIHGGANALRFTPHFRITSAEIGLMIDVLREVLTQVRDADA